MQTPDDKVMPLGEEDASFPDEVKEILTQTDLAEIWKERMKNMDQRNQEFIRKMVTEVREKNESKQTES